ncbi:hypothetical protein GCM10009769_32660 [Curtobacterium luteum]|uniref:Uncharacterized protein n=1 Tax=Curtobacterium luteum TaxID=33881 RepID=A0A8H9GEJ7_9MICO|nr:hypothetical protein GCM10009769_32660 [Curtobacterium luteum]
MFDVLKDPIEHETEISHRDLKTVPLRHPTNMAQRGCLVNRSFIGRRAEVRRDPPKERVLL